MGLLHLQIRIGFTSYVWLSHPQQFLQKKRVTGAGRLAALTRRIGFTSLTFETNTPCNFHIKTGDGLATLAKKYIQKQVIGQCRLTAVAKKIVFTSFTFNFHMSSIFYKKKKQVIGACGFAAFDKILESPHLHFTLPHFAIFLRSRW